MTRLRTTARALLRAPAFTGAAVLTFALGIGVNAAIFGAADAVLLHPLPGIDIRPIHALETDLATGPLRHARVSPQDVWELSDRRDVFTGVGGYRLFKVTLRDAGTSDEIDAASTAGGFFEALGVQPLLGRLYTARDVETSDQHIVVLSYDFWHGRLGGDRAVIGRTLTLDDSTYRVVAVMRPGTTYPRGVALWTPRPLEPFMDLDRNTWSAILLTSIARLRPGATESQLQGALAQQLATDLARHNELRAVRDVRLTTRPLADALAGQMRWILFAILVCGGCVLLTACANIASLQLVRVSALSRELAVRAALGAGRWAIAAQVGLETILVALVGGALGVLSGAAVVGVIRHSSSADAVSLSAIRLDPPVVATLFGLIVLAGALSAAASLRAATRVDPGDVLRASTRGASAGRRRDRFLRTVVAGQLAVAIVLLLGAVTAGRSLASLIDVSPGFDPVGVTAVRLILPSPRYSPIPSDTSISKPTNVTIFYDQLVARLRQRPGISAVGLVTGAPFGYVQSNEHKMFVSLPGRPHSPSDPFPDYWRVNDEYFRALGVPLRAGRAFSSTDESHRNPVIIIDDVLARRIFGDESPIGERLQSFGTVVGVVGSVKKADLTTPDGGSLYLPMAPWTSNDLTVVVRSTLPMDAVVSAVRTSAHELDPTLAVGRDAATALTAGIERSMAPRRLASRVVTGLALLSLTLAVVGVCGVMLYGVAQRRKEFGIRLALGATPQEVRRLVLREGARLVAIGLGIGVVIYWGIAGIARSLVFGVSARDPWTMLTGAVVLATVALTAAYLPAVRAGRVDPVRSLSSE